MATWRTSTTGGGSNTAFTVTEPTGKADGDFEFLLVSVPRAATVTTASGWTLFASFTSGGAANASFYVYYAGTAGSPFRSGAPGLSWTGTGLTVPEWHCCGVSLGGNPKIDASAGGGTGQAVTSTTNPDPPSATAVGSADEAIAIGFNWNGATWTAPSGYTMRSVNTGGLDGAVASKTLSASGAENPGTFTGPGGSNDAAALTILLALAAGGGATVKNLAALGVG